MYSASAVIILSTDARTRDFTAARLCRTHGPLRMRLTNLDAPLAGLLNSRNLELSLPSIDE